jgi:hypothetical protein
VEVKKQHQVKSQIGFQLWKMMMMMMMWTSIGLGKYQREYESFSHRQSQNYLGKESSLNCTGCRIQAKQMDII